MNNRNEGGYISLTTHELNINDSRNGNYSKNNRKRNNNNSNYAGFGGRQAVKSGGNKGNLSQLGKDVRGNGNKAKRYEERSVVGAAPQKSNRNHNAAAAAKPKKVEKLMPRVKAAAPKANNFKGSENKEAKAFRLK
jgi:hypothetical protein